MHRFVASLASVLTLAACAGGAQPAPSPAPQQPANGQAPQQGAGHAGGAKEQSGPRPYAEVITPGATADTGLFIVHQVKDKWYFEIPQAMLGREMLLVTRQAQTAESIGYGGEEVNEDVLTWERVNDKVLLRVQSYDNVAADSTPISLAVRNSNFAPIVAALDVAAYSKDSNQVVDVTPLYAKDVPFLGLPKGERDEYKIQRMDDSRSYIKYIHTFPTNVEVRVVQTYAAGAAPSASETGTISVEMNHSMILLPKTPMMPRLEDDRVGYFSVQQTDYSRPEQRAVVRTYITRWRLEPKDTAAFRRGELTEPVKPIVYYIDPATPAKWRPYLKQGIEDWNVAFEQAGFKNAIIARDPPADDPKFSLEDARYSSIRYFASPIENAYGPHVSDPRSGEILQTSIGWYHNVQNLLRDWFLIQTAAVNPAARGLELPDTVMGELIRFVSSHEVGHTLGLPHNMKASSAYPVDSLRSASFTRKYHTAPSIMDYARFNYVAQPGDTGVYLMPGIGVYDTYAIAWGYRPILDATTPDAEKPTLDSWIRAHDGDPMYRFGDPSSFDPGSQTEDLGDDGVKAGEYGIANLKRILPNLRQWSLAPGADYSQLQELYEQVLVQWARYMGHVVTIVGGVDETRKADDQPGDVYTVIPKARQARAMKFLAQQAFATPAWAIDTAILRRVEHAGIVERLRQRQVNVLNSVLDPRRMQRLIEAKAVLGAQAYSLPDMLGDLRQAVWTELGSGATIDPYRRNLQRGWLERMNFLMTQELPPIPDRFRRFFTGTDVNVTQSDIRPLVRGELVAVQGQIRSDLARVRDYETRMHLQDALARIDQTLNPRK
jgi:hypothetical protein